MQLSQLDLACITAGEPVAARHGVVLLADAEAMEVEVGPEATLFKEIHVQVYTCQTRTRSPPQKKLDIRTRREVESPEPLREE